MSIMSISPLRLPKTIAFLQQHCMDDKLALLVDTSGCGVLFSTFYGLSQTCREGKGKCMAWWYAPFKPLSLLLSLWRKKDTDVYLTIDGQLFL